MRYVLDPAKPMSAEQRERIKALKHRPVDFSDIPPQTVDETWYQPGPMRALENKQQVTLRIDADVLEFFRGTGRRYQTRINDVLREYMKAHAGPPPKG